VSLSVATRAQNNGENKGIYFPVLIAGNPAYRYQICGSNNAHSKLATSIQVFSFVIVQFTAIKYSHAKSKSLKFTYYRDRPDLIGELCIKEE